MTQITMMVWSLTQSWTCGSMKSSGRQEALLQKKPSGNDGNLAELFQILKMMLLKCCTQYISKFGKFSSGHRTEFSFHFNPKERQCQRMLTSRASKVMLKILQTRRQHYMKGELPAVQAGFRKDIGTRDQITHICWIMEKARKFQKNNYFCFIDYVKAFDCVNHNKLEKEYVKTVYCHTAYLTYMQSTSCEMPGWMKHKLESRLPREISNNLRYVDDTSLMVESEEELKSLLMRVKE